MAISPTILNRTSKSAISLRSSVSQTGRTANNILNFLGKGISRKRNIWETTQIFKKRRSDFEKQQSKKDVRNAPILSTRRFGSRSLAQADKSTSIADRLLGFVGYFSAGWLLGNLPRWINYGEQFVDRIGTARSILSNYGSDALKVITSTGDLFKAVLRNISSFDFRDRSGLIRNSMSELTNAIGNLGSGISQVLDVLFAPFKELPKPGEENPPPSENPPGAPPPSSQPGTSGKNADYWTLVAITALEDRDPQGRADVAQSIYNRAASGVFAGGNDIRKIILSGNGGQYQPVERAVREFHRIQDRETAIKAVMVADKLSRKEAEAMIDDTVSAISNPTLQRNAAQYIENRTDFVGVGLYPTRDSSTDLKRRTPNDNIFGNFVGPGSYEYGRKKRGASPVPSFGDTSSTAQTPSTPQPPSRTYTSDQLRRMFPSVSGTSGLSMGNRPVSLPYSPIRTRERTITSVKGWRRGRYHKGWDIAANSGAPIYSYFPGVVTHENRQPGWGNGYGYWIVWKDSIYGSYHFFGHMLKPAEVRVGQRFEQGKLVGYVGSTGSSTGPHLHWEISDVPPATNGDFGSNVKDIGVWLRNHPLISAQPMQISSNIVPFSTLIPPSPDPFVGQPNQTEIASIQGAGSKVNSGKGIVSERKGQQILIIDDRTSSPPPAQQNTSPSSGYLLAQANSSKGLNSYTKLVHLNTAYL